MAKISPLTGYGLPPNQRFILPVCLTFWLLFLLVYWSSAIIPLKPAESVDIELHTINTSSAEAQATSALDSVQFQAGQNDTLLELEEQESIPAEPEDEEPPEITYPRDLAANSTLGVSICLSPRFLPFIVLADGVFFVLISFLFYVLPCANIENSSKKYSRCQ